MLTLSKTEGIGGVIKSRHEDFIVREITSKGVRLEPDTLYAPLAIQEEEASDGRFVTFVLQKRGWDTTHALIELAKRFRRGRKSIGYAGNKDKSAVTVQLASIYGADPDTLMKVSMKDIKINGAWRSNGVALGSNLGNSFSVKIRQTHDTQNLDAIVSELNGVFPNYFDRQRFGYRLNNFRVGMHILNNELEEAAISFLTDCSNETDTEVIDARKRLADDRDFRGALGYFPRHLRYERTMIEYLSRHENYANAIRALPRGIAIMFIHAVEALIFNAALESRIKNRDYEAKVYCTRNFYGFPEAESITSDPEDTFPLGSLIGYETGKDYISPYEAEVMERLELSENSFKIRSLPEVSMRGALRTLHAPMRDVGYKVSEDEVDVGFSIPAGSYATIFIGELTKNDGIDISRIAPELG